MLLLQLQSIRYLMRQGLAARGHEDIEGNLDQLLAVRSHDVPALSTWLLEHKYLSHDIVNEIISLMGNEVLRSIVRNVDNAQWYGLMADETRDASGAEQFVVCLRWVTHNFEINEDMIGLVDVPSTDSTTLLSVLKDVLIRCNLSLKLCRGQTYDGASNMSGHLNGVAARFQAEQPAAISVHCLAHCTNLCLQEVTRNCKSLRDGLDTVHDVTSLIRNSPKRLHMFKSLQEMTNSGSTPTLKPLCPTRWTVRTRSIDSVLQNYSIVVDALEVISSSGSDEGSRKAGGLIALMDKFSTYFGMRLASLIFGKTEILATSLQTVRSSVEDAIKAVNILRTHFVNCRNDEAFHTFFNDIVTCAKDLTQDPVLPRQKRIPRKLDEGSDQHRFESVSEFYRYVCVC